MDMFDGIDIFSYFHCILLINYSQAHLNVVGGSALWRNYNNLTLLTILLITLNH
jgi:hypothetical protein